MEGVDEPPGDLGRERFEPGVAKKIKQTGNDAPAIGLDRERFGHVEFGGRFARPGDSEAKRLTEHGLELGAGGHL